MATIREMREKIAALKTEREKFLSLPVIENRTLNAPELERLEKINEEVTSLNSEITKALEARSVATNKPEPKPVEPPQTMEDSSKRNVSIISEPKADISLSRIFRELKDGKSDYIQTLDKQTRATRKDLDFNSNGIAVDLRASVTSTGGNSVSEKTENILEPLQDVTVFGQLGARFMNNLTGNIRIPLLSGDFAATILGENEKLTDSDFNVESIIYKPRRLAFRFPVSFQMLAQDDINLEAELKRQLSEAIGRGLENEVFKVGGTTKLAFEGFFKDTAATTPTPLDWGAIVDMETAIKSKNIRGGMRWIMPADTTGQLKKTTKAGDYPVYLLDGGNLNGYAAVETNAMPDSTAILASWAYFRVCNWAAVEVIADPYTGFSDGYMYFGINAFADCGFDHKEAFAARTFGTAAAATRMQNKGKE